MKESNWKDVCPYCHKEICVLGCRGLYVVSRNLKPYACPICDNLDSNEDRKNLAKHLSDFHDAVMIEYIFSDKDRKVTWKPRLTR